MKKIVLLVALVAMMVMVGCTSISPITATSNPVGSKVGEATVGYLFSIFPMGKEADTGILKAAQNGGITKISTVDRKVTSYGGFYAKVTTVVTGQ